jgi:hypothetical protein
MNDWYITIDNDWWYYGWWFLTNTNDDLWLLTYEDRWW